MRLHGIELATVLLLLFPSAAKAGEGISADLQDALRAAGEHELLPVIAHFRDRVDLDDHREGNRAQRRRSLVQALRSRAESSQKEARMILTAEGVEDLDVLWLINGLAFSARPALLRKLALRPEIERIGLDRRVSGPALGGTSAGEDRGPGPSPTAGAAAEWNIERIGAPGLWGLGLDGAGMVIASLDSGVDPEHQDLAARWRGGGNSWFDPNGEHASPTDKTGHGTQTMGLLVGGDAGGTSIGVAPGAEWIAAKIFDDPHSPECPTGCATYSAIHAGFQWVLDPDDDPGTDDAADVLSNSWGLRDHTGECVLEFQPDIQTLKAAGIAVVFSAGNEGPASSSSLSPANNPEGFGVGALDDWDEVDLFSSRGPSACGGTVFPEISAPGVDVWTADLTLGGVIPDAYTYASGTSFAAPHVAGGMLLLAQAFPAATPEQIESAILSSAVDLGAAGPDDAYGHGLLDLVAAHAELERSLSCTDGDGDTHHAEEECEPVADCDDGNAEVWSTPGEVRAVRFSIDRRTITWTEPAGPGGTATATRYDTLRSGDPSDFAGTFLCVESGDGSDTQADDGETPAPGGAFFYLVRAENDCPAGQGTPGIGAGGGERSAGECPW